MSNVITPPQCRHLIEVFENLGSGQMQALNASGLLTDLRRCAAELDPTKIDRYQYQKVLGLDPTVFKVKMDGSETTDQIMAALGFSFNEWINQENFPLALFATSVEDEIEIVDPNRKFDFSECPTILSEAGLLEPIYEHAIRFAQQHGKATTSTKKPLIIFPHTPWQDPRRDDSVVYLDRSPSRRWLSLICTDYGFDGRCVVAGVRPRRQSSGS